MSAGSPLLASFQGLGDLPGGIFSSGAAGVSADGSVVVGRSFSASGGEAFRWTAAGGMVGLGHLPGGNISQAFGVSADGSVVVGNSTSSAVSGDYEAFRWTAAGGMVGLGHLPSDISSQATGVSADGSVVVGASFSASGDYEAFRWTAAGGRVGLSHLPSESNSQATDVSADGSVVVGSSSGGPFIWDDMHGMRRLQDVLVNEHGLDLTGWTLSDARGISDDGLTVVGTGINPAGQQEAWIARLGQRQGVDLDVDSDNDNGLNDPGRTEAEEQIEDVEGLPGKRVLATVADLDADGIPDYALDRDHDGVPDFADGFDLDGFTGTTDDLQQVDPTNRFTPLVLEIPQSIDLDRTDILRPRITFSYDASDPALVTVTGTSPDRVYRPEGGHLRIWLYDADRPRNPARVNAALNPGSYVAPGEDYTATDLGLSNAFRTVTLYVEGIAPSAAAGDQRILVQVDPDGRLGPAGYISDAVRVTVTPSERPTVTLPAGPTEEGSGGWRLKWSVSPGDGLVVEDVYLGGRYMAQKFSLPYVVLGTNVVPDRRLDLKPDGEAAPGTGSAPPARSRLVDLSSRREGFSTAYFGFVNGLVVEATFVVETAPGDSITTLLVTQRYEFLDELGDAGEPLMTFPIARYRPLVRYAFFGQAGEVLTSFNSAQRLHFQVDGISPNVVTPFKDNAVPIPPFEEVADPFLGENPQLVERIVHAIDRGQGADADNVHQTYEPSVEPPGALPPHAGCPECAHIHWKWSYAAAAGGGFAPQFNSGDPLLPPGSDQSVDVAYVQFKPGEEDGVPRYGALVDGDFLASVGPGGASLGGTGDVVIWYSATGFRPHDEFFTHGGFFVPLLPRYVTPLVSVTSRGPLYLRGSNQWIEVVTITNTSKTTLTEPFALVVSPLSGHRLANVDAGDILGSPDRYVPVAGPTVLAPGESVQKLLFYEGPASRRPLNTFRVFNGPTPITFLPPPGD